MSENNPTMTGPVKTVGDMMSALETHIQDVLTGRMTDSQARHVTKLRGAQLKTAELQLQYARIFRGRTPDPIMRLLPQAEPMQTEAQHSKLTPDEQAILKALQEKAAG